MARRIRVDGAAAGAAGCGAHEAASGVAPRSDTYRVAMARRRRVLVSRRRAASSYQGAWAALALLLRGARRGARSELTDQAFRELRAASRAHTQPGNAASACSQPPRAVTLLRLARRAARAVDPSAVSIPPEGRVEGLADSSPKTRHPQAAFCDAATRALIAKRARRQRTARIRAEFGKTSANLAKAHA